jgi:hypothetical protein
MWLLEKDFLELEESEKLLQPLVIIQNKLKFRVNSLYSVMAERLCLIYPPPLPPPHPGQMGVEWYVTSLP